MEPLSFERPPRLVPRLEQQVMNRCRARYPQEQFMRTSRFVFKEVHGGTNRTSVVACVVELAIGSARQDKTRQAKPSQAKPSQAKPSQAKPSQAKPSQAKPSQDKTRQDKTRQDKTRHHSEKMVQRGRSSGPAGMSGEPWPPRKTLLTF